MSDSTLRSNLLRIASELPKGSLRRRRGQLGAGEKVIADKYRCKNPTNATLCEAYHDQGDGDSGVI